MYLSEYGSKIGSRDIGRKGAKMGSAYRQYEESITGPQGSQDEVLGY